MDTILHGGLGLVSCRMRLGLAIVDSATADNPALNFVGTCYKAG